LYSGFRVRASAPVKIQHYERPHRPRGHWLAALVPLLGKAFPRCWVKGLVVTVFASVGGGLGWWLGAFVGIMTAVVVSGVGSGVGVYAARRLLREFVD